MILLLTILLYAVSAPAQTPNCGCEDKPQINVLAVVNGVKITRQDLSVETRTQVNAVQDSVIAARSQALNLLISKALLDAESKRRGLTNTKLIEAEVTAKVISPTEADARAFYNENKERIGKDFKSVKKDILAQMKSEREVTRAKEFANALRVAAQVSVAEQQVTPPENEEDLARVYATVNGVNITSLDIEQSLLPLIYEVQKQVYVIRKRDLDLKINDMLLEAEAKRLDTTPTALVNQNVRAKMQIVSEEQARTFYNEHKSEMDGDFSKLKTDIFQFLQSEEERKRAAVYAEELRKAAAVQMYLTEPTLPNVRQLCCNPLD